MRKPVGRMPTTTFQTGVVVVSLLFLLFSLLLPLPSTAGGPTDQVRATVEKVIAVVRNPGLKSTAQKENRRTQLARVIHPRFDFTEMAKRSLGPHWGRRTSEEQREFVGIFTGLLGRLYADRIESYAGQQVLYTREVGEANYAEVFTRIVADNGREELSINYKLHNIDREWKVYDLVIDNVSLINNYRSQFDRVIVRSSFEDLVGVLKQKQALDSEKARPRYAAVRPQQQSSFASFTRILFKSVQY
jgi:phospholipid transport system substrate-binding protein